MDINGSMRIGVLHRDGAAGWGLHFGFPDKFQVLDLLRHSATCSNHVHE